MKDKFRYIAKKIITWRVKHISNKDFILILSMLIGVVTGIAALAMRGFTHLVGNSIDKYIGYKLYFIFPIVGFFIVFLIKKYVIKNDVSHGIPSILRAVAKQKGVMRRFQSYASILTAPITIGFGGSVGLEGPMVVTGAGISSNISRFFHINQSDRMLLLACACSAALSSIFKVPIAAILFAVEVFGLDLTLASLLPLFLSSLSGVLTSYIFFGSAVLIPIDIDREFMVQDTFSYVVLGVVGGLFSAYVSFFYKKIAAFFSAIKSPHNRIIVGGVLLGILVFIMPPLYGEGHEIINHLKEGTPELSLKGNIFNFDTSSEYVVIFLLLGLLFFKIFATSITFGAGGVGGIFSPALFMGAIMGNCFARIVNELFGADLALSNYTLVGMTSIMAGILHAPFTSIFLIAEVTGGYELIVPSMITVAVSFYIAKKFNKFSVYTMELGMSGELVNQDKDRSVLVLMDLESVIETNFVIIYSHMKLIDVVKAIKKSNRNIFPVVNQSRELQGVISLDKIKHLIFEKELYNKISVLELMEKPREIIDFDKDKVTDVVDKFQNTGAWNLPVLRDKKYVGFISKSKLLTVYRRKLIYFSNL